MEAQHLQGKNGEKVYPFSLRYLGPLLPPLPGKTSVLEGHVEGYNSSEDMSDSRWDFRVTSSGPSCKVASPEHGLQEYRPRSRKPARQLSGSLASLPPCCPEYLISQPSTLSQREP